MKNKSQLKRTERIYGVTVPYVQYAGGLTRDFGQFRHKFVIQDGIRFPVTWDSLQGIKGTWLLFRINHPVLAGITLGILAVLCICSVVGILLLGFLLTPWSGNRVWIGNGRSFGQGGGDDTDGGHYGTNTKL